MALTASQRRALEIVRDNPGIAPREFAVKMWPDSMGHERHHKCGPHGSTKGGMMNMAGGGYLGKLAKAGLLLRSFERYGSVFHLSGEGRKKLEE